jgi:FG-GAP repeat
MSFSSKKLVASTIARSLLAPLGIASLPLSAMAADFAPSISLSSLDVTTGIRFDGIAAGDNAGTAIFSAGDVNGDGFNDLVVGARTADSNGTDSGSVYVVFGAASGFPASFSLGLLNGSNGFEVLGESQGDNLGSAVSGGDVNGDGFSDVIIGADQAGTAFGMGAAYVIFGKASGFTAEVATAAMPAATEEPVKSTLFTPSMRKPVAAGDVNGDGLGDVVVGARGADFSANGAGAAYVILGKATSFGTAVSVSDLNGTNGFRLDGATADDAAGTWVGVVRDVNGDGIKDIVTGAPSASPDGEFSGSAYVFFGKTGGFSLSTNLGLLNGSNGFRIDGSGTTTLTGSSISGAGDVNGDGTGDIIVGSPFSGLHGAALIFGRTTAFPASISIPALDGSAGTRFTTTESNTLLGISLAAAGDINGDGFEDMIFGAQSDDVDDRGAAFVVFGKAASFGASFDLAALNGKNGFKLTGAAGSDLAGQAVSGGGDFNGDGFADAAVGAFFADPAGGESGSGYIVYGRAPTTVANRIGSAAGQYMSGGIKAETLSALGGGDELEGRKGPDKLKGGIGKDAASYRHAPLGLTADLLNPGNNNRDASGDTYESIESLIGTEFADDLSGDNLANVLTGGKGLDRLTGRLGSDVFRFTRISDSPPSGRDRINDFDAGSAATTVDRIDLSAIDAIAGPRNNSFTFIGTAPFGNIAGQLRLRPVTGGTIVSADVNGNSVADLEILLVNFSNIAAITSADFIR